MGGGGGVLGEERKEIDLEENHAFIVFSYFVPSPLSRQLAEAGCTINGEMKN